MPRNSRNKNNLWTFVRKKRNTSLCFEEFINKNPSLLPISEIIVFVSGKFLYRFYAPCFHFVLLVLLLFLFSGSVVSFPFLELKWVIALISIGTYLVRWSTLQAALWPLRVGTRSSNGASLWPVAICCLVWRMAVWIGWLLVVLVWLGCWLWSRGPFFMPDVTRSSCGIYFAGFVSF